MYLANLTIEHGANLYLGMWGREKSWGKKKSCQSLIHLNVICNQFPSPPTHFLLRVSILNDQASLKCICMRGKTCFVCSLLRFWCRMHILLHLKMDSKHLVWLRATPSQDHCHFQNDCHLIRCCENRKHVCMLTFTLQGSKTLPSAAVGDWSEVHAEWL